MDNLVSNYSKAQSKQITWVVDPVTSCWNCDSHRQKGTCIRIERNNQRFSLQNFTYIENFGTIPKGMLVKHTCNNVICCNPRHLKLEFKKYPTEIIKVNDKFKNPKLMQAYEYANSIAYRFEKIRCFRKDLVHEVILNLLEQPEKLDSIVYVKSFIYRLMKWKRSDMKRSNYERRTDNIIDSPIESIENSSWLDLNNQVALNCSECHTDIEIVKDYIETKEFSKGNTREIFNLMLLGFTPKEISQKLNIGQHSVNQSVCNTRIKLNNYFRK